MKQPATEYHYASCTMPCSGSYLVPVLRRVLRESPREGVIVDLGCGNGSMLGQIQRPGWALHGFELSESGLAQGRKAYPGIAFEHSDLTRDLSSHPLAGKCDVVISTEVVEHVFLPRNY